MWQFIWLGVISFLVMSLLILNHFMKVSREGFATITVDRPNTDVSTTNLNIKDGKTDDPRCPTGQISAITGGKCTGPIIIEQPNSYTVDIVKSTKISQPPFPPCVGYVDEVVYAPSDINANIVQIKADLVNLQKNIPIYVVDGVSQQADLRVKGILRQNGFPLTDDLYAQNDPTFNCN